MSSNETSDSDELISSEITKTENTMQIPPKSVYKYTVTYDNFIQWTINEKVIISENTLIAYLTELSKTKKPSTLWAMYSMLKTTLNINNNINIKNYHKLTAFLKKQSVGFKPKKIQVLTVEQVKRFLDEAPDDKYLAIKRLSYTYRGLIVPVFTPFNDDGTLNLNIIPQYATYLAKKEIKGILVNGTSGEGMSMSVAERKLVTETWVKAVKETKQHLMIQVGGAPLPDVIELAKHASSLNVDSILCLPELYFKPTTPEQLIEYLEIVGKAAPRTPLLYYHVPIITDVNIHMGQFLESIGDKIPSFVGVKFTSADLAEGAQALRADNKKYVIFLGNDQLINAAYALGMDSFILTSINMFPELILDLLAVCKNKDFLKAKDMQEKLSSAVIAIMKHGNWVQTMKVAMDLLTDIDVGLVRAPLKYISSEAVAIMVRDLTNLGYHSKVKIEKSN